MSWNPNLIFYACIAKETTILAEFSSKEADLSDLAQKCLEKTPKLHSIFSHTAHSKTYMFFIFDPFVYFGIFDELLENPNCLLFLKSVKDAFTGMIDNCTSGCMNQRLNSPISHCFQGKFNPVFHQILDSNPEVDSISSPTGLNDFHRWGLDSLRRKKRLTGSANRDGSEENKPEILPDEDVRVSSGCKLQKAMSIWKKQVIAVLSMDLIVCTGLFVIWVWVCKGFQCVAN